MHVFVTGASGFIGSAVVQELINAGHTVVGLARTDAAAKALSAAGAEVLRGMLEDTDSLKHGAAMSDGVIHTAFIHDFKDIAAAGRTDTAAVEAIGNTLAGSGRPFVVTSGIATLTPGKLGTEADGPDKNSAGKHRIASEELTLAFAAQGVRSSIVRLPPSVHGDGDHGFVPALIATARDKKVSAYVGEGKNHWCAVHRFDAAVLFRLALEKGEAGSRFHGIADERIPFIDIATLIGKRLNVPLVSKSVTEAPAHFGWIGHFAAADVLASSRITRDVLGWKPGHLSLLDDLEKGTYFRQH